MGVVWDILWQFWAVLAEMAPYLLFGFAVAGLLSVLISPRWVERHLGGRGLLQVVKATLFGIPLPLCSCGVIPVSASLRRHGASKAATTGFLLSTPQTGVDSIFVTYSLLGPVYTLFRPLAALVNGLVGGAAVHLFGGDEPVPAEVERRAAAEACPDGCAADATTAVLDRKPPVGHRLREAVRYGFVALPQDIGRALVVGVIVAGLIGVFVPPDFFTQYPWLSQGLGGMLVMMLIGIPLYVCATASVPMAAALIYKGMSPGAVVVFLMTGPATNAATISIIWKVMGRRTAVVYLASVVVTALASGFALDGIYAALGTRPQVPMHAGHAHAMASIPAWQHAAGVALLLVLAYALLGRYLRRRPAEAPEAAGRGATMAQQSAILNVSGMTCNHCANSVKRALQEVPGVDEAQVDLQSGRAVVRGRKLDVNRLVEVVNALGYATKPAQAV